MQHRKKYIWIKLELAKKRIIRWNKSLFMKWCIYMKVNTANAFNTISTLIFLTDANEKQN
jgi:5-bromo-4-chloroindolyl phosphate hydrolysis protein